MHTLASCQVCQEGDMDGGRASPPPPLSLPARAWGLGEGGLPLWALVSLLDNGLPVRMRGSASSRELCGFSEDGGVLDSGVFVFCLPRTV